MCVLLVAKLCLTLLQPHGLQLARLLRLLCPWAFPGKILEWVAISFSRDLPDPGMEPASPAVVGLFFTPEPPEKPPDTWVLTLIQYDGALLAEQCFVGAQFY